VPWASVRKAQGDFIAAKFVPTGWKLDDPSKIQLADADRLLELWCQRQKDHVRPTFEFKGWEGDNKTMREPAEATSRKGSDTRCKNTVKKHTRKRTGRVEQESSSEDEEKGNDEEKDGDKEKDDNKEKDDDDDNGTLPPPKSKPVKNAYRSRNPGQSTHAALVRLHLLQSTKILAHQSRNPDGFYCHLNQNRPKSVVGLVTLNLI
jgi:hypothetical protein